MNEYTFMGSKPVIFVLPAKQKWDIGIAFPAMLVARWLRKLLLHFLVKLFSRELLGLELWNLVHLYIW